MRKKESEGSKKVRGCILYWITALSHLENCPYDMLIITFTSGRSYYYSVRIVVMRIVYIVTKAVSLDIQNQASYECIVGAFQQIILMLKA